MKHEPGYPRNPWLSVQSLPLPALLRRSFAKAMQAGAIKKTALVREQFKIFCLETV